MITVLQDQPNFPDIHSAGEDGLLAVGGQINAEWLAIAYPKGIFPWYDETSPPLWFSPDPRCVLVPSQVHQSKSMRRLMTKGQFTITFNRSFPNVLSHCKTTQRPGQEGTWITRPLENALLSLHDLRLAHSIEVWRNDQLVGGLYGLAFGQVFFGESMFSLEPNASKAGLIQLCTWLQKWGYQLIDCQVETNHLLSMGAKNISRIAFQKHLHESVEQLPAAHAWNPL